MYNLGALLSEVSKYSQARSVAQKMFGVVIFDPPILYKLSLMYF